MDRKTADIKRVAKERDDVQQLCVLVFRDLDKKAGEVVNLNQELNEQIEKNRQLLEELEVYKEDETKDSETSAEMMRMIDAGSMVEQLRKDYEKIKQSSIDVSLENTHGPRNRKKTPK